jgi:hypothetical protein
MSLGLSHRRVLLILYATCTLFGLAGLALVIAPSWGLALACVGLIAAQYGLMWRIRRLRQWPAKP